MDDSWKYFPMVSLLEARHEEERLLLCQDDNGEPLHWGQLEPRKLYDPDTGWCEAAAPQTRFLFYVFPLQSSIR